MARFKSAIPYALALLVGSMFAGLVVLIDPTIAGGSPAASEASVSDILDLPDPDVAAAAVEPELVQWGTQESFKGTGAPGINVRIKTPGSVIDWTLEAWATQRTPAPVKACSNPTIHFDRYDWTYQANGDPSQGEGLFMTVPTTVPERLGPAGDQCLARIQATGTWTVLVCIEGQGDKPRGIYDAPDGRHVDSWDLCVERDVQVPS